MKHHTISVLAFVTLCFVSAEAEAKRLRIPIPFLGSSEEIVLVKELPDTEALRRDDGKYIDLGYLHTSGGGKWIGHIGSDSQYVKLDGDLLKVFMLAAGLKELPPVPEGTGRHSSWFTYLCVAICLLFALSKFRLFFRRFKQRVDAGQTAGLATDVPQNVQISQPFRAGYSAPLFGQGSQSNQFGRR